MTLPILGDPPQQNIDTGMGLERVAFLKQGVQNIYEIDQIRPVLDRAAEPLRSRLRCKSR
jgi:alanyl-tRNA synthetase